MSPSRVVIEVLLCGAFLTTPVMAQVANNPATMSYHDYFTADQDGVGQYMRIVESAHVVTIPRWLSQNRVGDAMSDIRYTLDRFPNHPVSLQQLSMVAQMMKNRALAVGYFERAIKLFPQYALTHAQYGLYLASTGDADAGIGELNQAIEIDPKLPAGYAGLAHALMKKGDVGRAREAAQKARELGFTGKLPDGL